MLSLNLETTRRCNLKCLFCARGHAQNMDMSPVVIDTTLDQLQKNNVYVESLRLNGGEPFLAPDSIEYIVDGIIKRELPFATCAVFTNGTVRNEKVRNALGRLADYLAARKWELTNPTFDQQCKNLYRSIKTDERVSLIISQQFHKNADAIQRTIDYYDNYNSYVGIGLQNELHIAGAKNKNISIEGLAEQHLNTIIGDRLDEDINVRKIENRYSFVKWNTTGESGNTIKSISKAIGVSANGNVFPGALMPYDKIDTAPICNVIYDNIFAEIERYCWRYPITRKMSRFREERLAIDELQLTGIKIHDKYNYDLSDGLMGLIDMFAKIAHQLHNDYTHISPDMIFLGAAIILCESMKASNANDEIIEIFIDFFLRGTFDEDICKQLLSHDGRNELWNTLNYEIDPRRYLDKDYFETNKGCLQNQYARQKAAEAAKRADNDNLKRIREKLGISY